MEGSEGGEILNTPWCMRKVGTIRVSTKGNVGVGGICSRQIRLELPHSPIDGVANRTHKFSEPLCRLGVDGHHQTSQVVRKFATEEKMERKCSEPVEKGP